MIAEKRQYRVLVVSSSDKVCEHLYRLLPPSEFSPILRVKTAGEARRQLFSGAVDILIINTPLTDDFGVQLALDMSDDSMGILLLVKEDLFDQVSYRVEDSGVFTLAKPSSRQVLYSTVKMMAVLKQKLDKLERKTQSLQEKMADIRAVNRAKWLLIENLKMSEKDAHYYIEKQAMDARIPRREIAENIIRTYDA